MTLHMKNLFSFLLISIVLFSCGPNTTTPNTTQITLSYPNACCCNTIFNIGAGKIYIPSMFTPNNDGMNDAFRVIGDSNIKYITNVVIINSLNIAIATIDTMFSLNTTKNWNGKLIDNLTYEGNFSCTFNVVDKTNAYYSYTGNSASYIKTTHANTLISNYANCKFEDQFDNTSFTTPYLTNEIHFK